MGLGAWSRDQGTNLDPETLNLELTENEFSIYFKLKIRLYVYT